MLVGQSLEDADGTNIGRALGGPPRLVCRFATAESERRPLLIRQPTARPRTVAVQKVFDSRFSAMLGGSQDSPN